jgi:large subunit ribosomal protein L31
MKSNIHPKWFPEAKITCLACGTVWTVGSTRPTLQVDVCSNCHPFYTGEQRIVDTEGRVDRFMKRLETRTTRAQEIAAKTVGSPEFRLAELGLGKQHARVAGSQRLGHGGRFHQAAARGGRRRRVSHSRRRAQAADRYQEEAAPKRLRAACRTRLIVTSDSLRMGRRAFPCPFLRPERTF